MKTKCVAASIFLFVAACLFPVAARGESEGEAAKQDTTELRVAVLPFESDFQGNRDSGAIIAEILAGRLAVSGNLTLLDRADIDKVLKEQRLGASGAIAADQAVQIGQLLGVQILITGRTVTTDKNIIVFCKAISVQSGQLKGMSLILSEETDLSTLIDKTAEKLEKSLPVWAKKLLPPAKQPISHAENLQKLAKKKVIPGIAVWIPEAHFGRFVIDPAVETEFQMLLTEAGIQPIEVNPKTIKSLKEAAASNSAPSAPTSAVTVIVPSTNSSQTEEATTAPVTMDLQKMRALFPNVRFLICGEAFSEDGQELHGLVVSSARAEVKIIDLQSGKIIIVDRATDHAPDLSPRVAGKTALQKAGRKLALRMLPKLIDRFEDQK